MPGMNSGLNIHDPTVVAAFKQALLHQGIAAALLFALLGLAWVVVRELRGPGRLASEPDGGSGGGPAGPPLPEAPARRLLRIGFGLLWIFDGVLQAQPGMAVGLPSQVIQPTAASSPSWVQHLVNWAGTSWSYHPIEAAAGAVWIQVGIGIWLLLASRGRMSRLAGLTTVGWGLVVWVFGESFGGVFAPGLSWLTGAPGAALCYCVAGALIALPDRVWRTARTGRLMLTCLGAFLVGMAVLQAWPGRGFWQGDLHGQPGSLTTMAQSMASLSQPSALADLVSAFASAVQAHGFAINLIAVTGLGATGLALLGGRPRIARTALFVLTAFCLVTWVLVQDLGFFGGLGTDPNSMLPMLLLAYAGYLAASVRPEAGAEPQPSPSRSSWRQRLGPANLPDVLARANLATVASAGAIGVILLGAIPMAAAQASSNAAPILAQAVDGSSTPLNSPAPVFALTDQNGSPVSLTGLRGKVVLLTFLDPVCVTDCPLIGQEFREAAVLLRSQASRVELVAVNLNPLYNGIGYLRAFDREEQLSSVPNWAYLTGTPAQLQPVWKAFGMASQAQPAGAMLGHTDNVFVIGPDGHLRQELEFAPGPGTAPTVSSFATELADAAEHLLGES
jgi:cytochrome oxidase Cu insertion factor (SCO1/SenC/PrrC family)